MRFPITVSSVEFTTSTDIVRTYTAECRACHLRHLLTLYLHTLRSAEHVTYDIYSHCTYIHCGVQSMSLTTSTHSVPTYTAEYRACHLRHLLTVYLHTLRSAEHVTYDIYSQCTYIHCGVQSMSLTTSTHSVRTLPSTEAGSGGPVLAGGGPVAGRRWSGAGSRWSGAGRRWSGADRRWSDAARRWSGG